MWHPLRMKYGIAATTSVTPATTPQSQADYVRRMAQTAEDAGFDSVWISDRTVYPKDLAASYPDEFGLGKADPSAQNVLEAVTTLSYIAGATTRVKVGMSVLVLPFRHPVLNAKMRRTGVSCRKICETVANPSPLRPRIPWIRKWLPFK
jgi:alkanesulfonate monooxygenase SsuD/methylene tetrahydromethanopterin reductase-like flavin-dependent oxidoreductase (luciferase family)